MTNNKDNTNLPNIKSARVILINEINNNSKEFSLKEQSSIKTIGILKSIDIENKLLLLEYNQHQIYCKTDAFQSDLPNKINQYYQIIGELNKPNVKQRSDIEKQVKENNSNNQNIKITTDWVLNSRVYRLVEGMNIELFKESLLVKRNFEKSFQSILNS